jgi:hypothetical protein
MKVDHITYLSNNSNIRDTKDIYLLTVQRLEQFKITGSKIIDFPESKLQVRITHPNDGTAAFDMMKDNQPAIVNFCCFEKGKQEDVFEVIRELTKAPVRTPDTEMFLYSFPINPFGLTREELMLCGEVEFYIWYMLYLAYKK